MSPSASLLSGELAERYVIEGEIGRGGTAIVYRARDRQRGIAVAIKVMREDLITTVSLERFLLEIRRTMTLQHPHIVPVLDSGQHQGMPYSVLPFMDGGTLRERLLRDKQLPLEEVVSLGATIARALEFAHQRGVVHRDVKPENILYTNGQPCLSDFGTARAFEGSMNDPTTSTGVVRGTAAYMSPEQASGERELDGRSDVYSLACVLYECTAGVQPFVGPSAQAVISQRLVHVPRPVSVYRPTVSAELEQVLVRATATLPADRYQGAGELASALQATGPSLNHRRAGQQARQKSRVRRSLVAAVVATTAIASASAAYFGAQGRLARSSASIDTTLIAVLPVEVEGNGRVPGQELLTEALRRWDGVSAVETFAMNDAVRQKSREANPAAAMAAMSIPDVAQLAGDLGAGRFIKSRFTEQSGIRSLYAALYDVRSRTAVHQAQLSLPTDSLAWPAVYSAIVDSLMLRGDRAPAVATRSLPARQTYIAAWHALSEWDLAGADSLFQVSLSFDDSSSATHLWLAQVRSWRLNRLEKWAADAAFAARHQSRLTNRERSQAIALDALGSGNFDKACATYERIIQERPRDFIGWYGLGECHRLDRTVVPDSSSRSGWRFRRSYWRGIEAYSKAFKLLPTAARGVQSRTFEPLQQFLFTGSQVKRGGVTGGPTDAFLARAAADHDTLVFVPILRDSVARGIPMATPQAMASAFTVTRRTFREIVSAWSNAFPRSASMKEAVGVALVLLGDPAAADTFAVAATLATDPGYRLRLHATEAVTRAKLGIAGDIGQLTRAVSIADSVLANHSADSTLVRTILPLATLTGRCAEAATLARRSSLSDNKTLDVPPQLRSDAWAAVASSSAGCRSAPIPDVERALRAARVSDSVSGRLAYDLLAGVVAIRFPAYPELVKRLARSGDYVLATEARMLEGRLEDARQLMAPILANRQKPGAEATPDALHVEARLCLLLGDTATAYALAEKAAKEMKFVPPTPDDQFATSELRVGAIAGIIEVLAVADPSPPRRINWSEMLDALWRHADPELRNRISGHTAAQR